MKDILRIIRFSKNLWPLYSAVAISSILIALLSQFAPLLTKAVIDELVAGFNQNNEVRGEFIILMVVLIFLSDVGVTIFSNIGGYIGDILAIRLDKLLSSSYYEHLLKLSQKYFDDERTGTIINYLTRSINTITRFVNMFANNFFQFILSTVLTLGIVAYFSWEVALMLGVLYPIILWLTQRTSKTWQKYQHRINRQSDLANGRFAEVIGQIKAVKSYVQEKQELNLFLNKYRRMVELTKKQSLFWHRQDVNRRLVLNLIFFSVYGYVIWKTAIGAYTIGEMVLLIQYSAYIRIPIFSMSFIVDQTQHAIAGSKDFFKVMDTIEDVKDLKNAKNLKVTNGEIEFKNVSFNYGKENVLKNIDFVVKPSKKVALVGVSGQGKSTIAHLLFRLYDPSQGAIYIDGQNIAQVSQASLRRNIAVVFQDPTLFSGTIQENIAYGKKGASKEEIIKAAKAAYAHEFISAFEKGYESEIGERGIKLSGGQKQRIAIARAILKGAPILILDEATSSLDSKAELIVQKALNHLMKNRTTLIIAHRLATIAHADEIITLIGGKIDEIGTPKKLSKTGGIYSELLQLQNMGQLAKNQMEKFEIS